MLNWIKWQIAGKELAAIERYRKACHLVWRWNGGLINEHSAKTAQWINAVGEGNRGADISEFRDSLSKEPT